MNAISLLLLLVIVLLLLYIVLFVHRKEMPKNSPNTGSKNSVENKKQPSVIGKTKTSFPSQRMERKGKEIDENREEESPTFAPGSPSVDDKNEFNPMSPENETDAEQIESEALSILLDEEIEVSTESLTTKEIHLMQLAVERNVVTEQEKKRLLQTAEKIQGSDFLEKLKSHEQLQSKLNAQLMQLLVGNETSATQPEISTEDWTSFL